MDLFSLSACRTALGDSAVSLDFAGLALQAGARSAIGSLWYVDDLATSAFFVQMYRYLDAGIPKAEAMQLTRQALFNGQIRLDGSVIRRCWGSSINHRSECGPAQFGRCELSSPLFLGWDPTVGLTLVRVPSK